ncbi:hypothetical protein GA0116948_10411 [Chitinophaga costaii]|uniref:Uncharacterized protein n=1 Tax=Chitinophaga costaii TaxID=1335309 RepID=A0A1C4C8W5_9BACT|nr:hypothetical protein [Chitinophaga costaii]SCC15535.1 hypothetical protein GA0116948_10411 [Chitinophaga costaii]
MRANLLFVIGCITCWCMNAGCAPKVYHAPAMGAETKFDKGLPKEKHPPHLFNKRERKEMARMGYPVN